MKELRPCPLTVTIHNDTPKPPTFGDFGYVQVVRCKDCKHRNDSLRCPLELLKEWMKYTRVFTYGVPDDWFCADGERRTDDA